MGKKSNRRSYVHILKTQDEVVCLSQHGNSSRLCQTSSNSDRLAFAVPWQAWHFQFELVQQPITDFCQVKFWGHELDVLETIPKIPETKRFKTESELMKYSKLVKTWLCDSMALSSTIANLTVSWGDLPVILRLFWLHEYLNSRGRQLPIFTRKIVDNIVDNVTKPD